ncbi:MAG: cyanophycinase [Planctomycetota bacterium]|jgi:cyanophycinase
MSTHPNSPRIGAAPLLASAMMLGLTACMHPGPKRLGELVIVGGGLQTENSEVMGEFIHDVGAQTVVLPTASGVPERSGPATVADFELYAVPGQTVSLVEIHADTPERAFEAAYVQPLEQASAAWFTGGVQSRILAVFRPEPADSPAYKAVCEILRRGGTVGGSSAGAAMMCDPMIAWGNSRDALLVGVRGDVEDRALAIEKGMGFFPFGMVDQHFLRRGRIGRLVVALQYTDQKLGFGIAENAALAVDLATQRGRALGDPAVIVLDASDIQQDGLNRRGLRVSLMSSGDEVDLEHGTVHADPEKRLVETLELEAAGEHGTLGPWDRYALSILMEGLARDPLIAQRATGDAFELVLRADERTRFAARDEQLAGFTVIDAILDIEALEGAQNAAEELRGELASGDKEN